MKRWIAILLIVLPLVAHADHPGTGSTCASNNDCQGGLICISGGCGHCSESYDCPGQICESGVCMSLPGGIACHADEDCGQGETCNLQTNQCQTPPPPPATPPPAEPELAPLLPRLEIPLLTLQPFTKPTQKSEGNRTFLEIDFIGQYLAGVYKFFVGIVGVIAGLMIIWAGVKWLTAAGSPDKIGEAKRHIADASVGLILVLGSYVILNIINPELVFFKPLRVEVVPKIELTIEEQEEEEATVAGQAVVAGTVCNTPESCRELCNQPLQTWPTASAATPDPGQLQKITATAGIDVSSCKDGCKGTAAFVAAIRRAGEIAQARPDGPYTIAITSAFRPLNKQIELICRKINCSGGETKCVDKGTYDPKKLGRAIAWPGGSNHGKGIAADVALVRGSKLLTCSGCYDEQTSARYAETAGTLADIMVEAGLTRYCKEIWHFELPSSADCRSTECRSNTISCP